MTSWPRQIEEALRDGPCVLVTLNRIAGSAPRESGSRMVVTADRTLGSIGGGNLEYTAIAQARRMLVESARPRQVHQPFGLGPALNQCCGGAVRLLFEVMAGACPDWVSATGRALEQRQPAVLAQALDGDPPVRALITAGRRQARALPREVHSAAVALLEQNESAAGQGELPGLEVGATAWWLERIQPDLWPLCLFGAGHVGREVARLLERLPFRVRWVDSRPGVFPALLHGQVQAVPTSDPVAEVASAEPDSIYVVMTHSHQLDEDICFEVLRRGDFRWLGLIGSATKRKRFVHRLRQRGMDEALLERLVCPIGIGGIRGKQPATIALSLAAQLMEETPWTDARH
jgi:xanthine dehydrogenase accessory factor